MHDGKVSFLWDTGSGLTRLEYPDVQINNSKWHRINATRSVTRRWRVVCVLLWLWRPVLVLLQVRETRDPLGPADGLGAAARGEDHSVRLLQRDGHQQLQPSVRGGRRRSGEGERTVRMMLLWVWSRVTALVFVPDTPGGENDPLQRLRERSGAQREQHRLVELRRETGRVRRLLHEVRRTLATSRSA